MMEGGETPLVIPWILAQDVDVDWLLDILSRAKGIPKRAGSSVEPPRAVFLCGHVFSLC